jgi:uncharacterized protein (DUF2249 family)
MAALAASSYVFLSEEITMTNDTSATLDVRALPPRERHPVIFSKLDSLQPGESVQLVNDHSPKPLYYQLIAERPDQFDWQPEQEGPEEWIIRITRRASAT